jgi:hypothetical protein
MGQPFDVAPHDVGPRVHRVDDDSSVPFYHRDHLQQSASPVTSDEEDAGLLIRLVTDVDEAGRGKYPHHSGPADTVAPSGLGEVNPIIV